MLGVNPLVRDNLLVLLTAMGCHCVLAPGLKEALVLLEKAKPDAAILDPQADALPDGIVAAFHRKFPSLETAQLFSPVKRHLQKSLTCLMHIRFPGFPCIGFCKSYGPAWIRCSLGTSCPGKPQAACDLSLIAFSSRCAPVFEVRSLWSTESFTNPRVLWLISRSIRRQIRSASRSWAKF